VDPRGCIIKAADYANISMVTVIFMFVIIVRYHVTRKFTSDLSLSSRISSLTNSAELRETLEASIGEMLVPFVR